MSEEHEEQPTTEQQLTTATPTANILPHRPKANATQPWYGAVTNYSKGEIRAYCRRLLSSDEYRKGLEAALIARTLPPTVEVLLWHYAFGKPVDQIRLEVQAPQEDLAELSTEQLKERVATAFTALEEAKALEEAIEVEAQAATGTTSP